MQTDGFLSDILCMCVCRGGGGIVSFRLSLRKLLVLRLTVMSMPVIGMNKLTLPWQELR